MKIKLTYLSLPRIEVQSFIWKQGMEYGLRLQEIDLATCEPVYKPLFSIWRRPGILYVETEKNLLMLMSRKPFFHLEKREV
jgi:hypothetical protein